MAKYLKPRRGKRITASSQEIILKRGEVFFEVPDTGVGKGIGKIKMGDGITPYKDLPYYLEQKESDVSNLAITFNENSSDNIDILFGDIISGATTNIIISAIKKLLMLIINNKSDKDHNHDESYYLKSEVYSKLELDNKYYDKSNVYTKNEADNKYYTKQEVGNIYYTKQEIDQKLTEIKQMLGDQVNITFDSNSNTLDINSKE